MKTRAFALGDLLALMVVLPVAMAMILPSLKLGGDNANRAVCSNNIKQIIVSFALYAQGNNSDYPTVEPPAGGSKTSAVLSNNPHPRESHAQSPQALDKLYYPPHHARGRKAGNPTANLWLLVLNGQMTTKSFICQSDPYTSAPALQMLPGAHGKSRYFDNFGGGAARGDGESYSTACPWIGKKDAPWWNGNGTNGSDVPLVSDMAPANTIGVKPASAAYRHPAVQQTGSHGFVLPNVWNSANHAGRGQNVGFGDTHVSWKKTPFCGDNGDNIFTTDTARGPLPNLKTRSLSLKKGIVTATWSKKRPDTVGSYDTAMVPIQDTSTMKSHQGFWK